MVPLFAGVPGGPELLVILFVAVVMFGLPIVLIVAGVIGYKRLDKRDRVEELEARIEKLERNGEEEDEDGRKTGSGDDA